jgi:hypothetical protein
VCSTAGTHTPEDKPSCSHVTGSCHDIDRGELLNTPAPLRAGEYICGVGWVFKQGTNAASLQEWSSCV